MSAKEKAARAMRKLMNNRWHALACMAEANEQAILCGEGIGPSGRVPFERLLLVRAATKKSRDPVGRERVKHNGPLQP